MKKDSLAGPLFVGFLFIFLLPAALVFLSLNAMTPPDGGVLTDCVVTDFLRIGNDTVTHVDYVNSAGQTINAQISNGVGGRSAFAGQHYQCYVYDDNPYEVYRKPDKSAGILMYAGAAGSVVLGLVLVVLLLKKRGVQSYLIRNGTQTQATITNVAIKGGGSSFIQCVCDYSFADSSGQMHTGKHTFAPNKRVSIGNYFPVMYAEKSGKMLSDIIE